MRELREQDFMRAIEVHKELGDFKNKFLKSSMDAKQLLLQLY